MTNNGKSILAALSAVMEEVQAVGKTGRNTQQGYNFRGVDAVVNAVGPVLRKHGVIVVPTSVVVESEHYETAKGTPMRGVTLTVGFRFYGPAGDFIEATVCGESADSGDKAVPKAHSVAYRTLLLQALCIPTDEPDPDASSYERGSQATGARADSGSGAAERASSSPADHPAPDRASRRTIPENLAHLDELLKTLGTMDGTIEWRESAANVAARFFGERDFSKLKAAELQSVVDEVERWAAGRQPQETPFS